MKGKRFLVALIAATVLVFTGIIGIGVAPANAGSPNSYIAATSNEPGRPNDTYYQQQWALPFLEGSLTNIETREITVAILDSGIDTAHEDLVGKVTGSVNFTDSQTELDVQGHGTHIAGIIAANINNGIGIAGIAKDVKLLNVKVVEDKGTVWPSNVAKGIIWAVDHGAQVINMSFTISSDTKNLADAVKYAADHHVVMFAAAGNRINSRTYPAAYPEVIAVAALNSDGTIWSGSINSDKVDVYAPGAEIYSTTPGNKYEFKSGSSMATAYASGMAVNVLNGLGTGKDLRPDCNEIKLALKNISDKLLKK
jgi:subtilisin family serine protease